jgi:hypothetical protein
MMRGTAIFGILNKKIASNKRLMGQGCFDNSQIRQMQAWWRTFAGAESGAGGA